MLGSLKHAAIAPLVGASLDMSLYTDPACQHVQSASFQTWEVSSKGCSTVTSGTSTSYLQYACVDRGIFQLTYPDDTCTGRTKAKTPKTWHWWLSMVRGDCTFDHLEAAYLKFSEPPPLSLTSRVGHCDVTFITEKIEYADAHCKTAVGEVQELNYGRSGCLDVTGTGSGRSTSYRVGTKFRCAGRHLIHEAYADYYYCSGEPLRSTVHTEAWFHTFSQGKCVKDVHSNMYFKLTSPMPSDWTASVRDCHSTAAARLDAYDVPCSPYVERNASAVIEWEAIDQWGCISVVATSSMLPLYKQRFRCVHAGEHKYIALEIFPSSSCRTNHFMEPPESHNVTVEAWKKLLAGDCIHGGPWAAEYAKLVGLMQTDRANLQALTWPCTEEVVAKTTTQPAMLAEKETVSSTPSAILSVDGTGRQSHVVVASFASGILLNLCT
eukprot:TRINITY_DN76881_c0_g1_i1.p1 TRINITY_DN76881_c0_g1~~TRINITY_DN76881_c0_g1_i1.p1  ORF type:complete len:453 (+),score=63.66 TRINITY_DN76881_c0_g1_i1:51-1361(+)